MSLAIVRMTKVLIFVKRPTNAKRAAFFEWLLNEHLSLARKVPGVRRYTISLEAEGEDRDFDALLEFWFDGAKVAERGFEDANGKALMADLTAHVAHLERINVAEHKFVDAAKSAPFKLVAALKRRADLTREEFKSWWLDKHAPIVVAFPELGRYQVDIVEDGQERFADGIASLICRPPAPPTHHVDQEVKDTQQFAGAWLAADVRRGASGDHEPNAGIIA